MARSEPDDVIANVGKDSESSHRDCAGPLFDKGCEGRLQIEVTSNFQNDNFASERLSCGNCPGSQILENRSGRWPRKIGELLGLRRQFEQQIEPLTDQLGAKEANSRHVAARPV